MLGRRSTQTGLFDARALLGAEQISQIPFYGDLAASWRDIFRDEDFAEVYAPRGRRSIPPSVLATATLLQRLEGISDAEVVQRTRYDLRWKAVFDTDPCSLSPLFAKSTFQYFRLRLILHEKQGLIFDAVLEAAKRRGLLSKRMQLALDSTPIRGRGAVKDAFNLLSDAVASLVRKNAEVEERDPQELAQELDLERHLKRGSIKGSRVVDWDNEASVRAFLSELVADCQRASQAAEAVGVSCEELTLLRKILEENVEEDAEGAKIRQGVPKGRTTSVHDPEMRHGHKSSGKKYTGHKAHVAVDTDSLLVTAVEMSEPSSPEGSHVASLIKASQERTEATVSEALGDCAYGCERAQQEAAEVGVPLVTKMPSPPKGRFGPGDFVVNKDRTEARCPAGHAAEKVYRAKEARNFMWSPELCGACPFKSQCLRGEAKRRTLRARPDFHDRRRREAYAKTPEGREKLRKRTLIEHAIGRLKNLGAGQAIYLGRVKTLFQLLACAAVANLRRVLKSAPALASQVLFVALVPLLFVLSASPALAEVEGPAGAWRAAAVRTGEGFKPRSAPQAKEAQPRSEQGPGVLRARGRRLALPAFRCEVRRSSPRRVLLRSCPALARGPPRIPERRREPQSRPRRRSPLFPHAPEQEPFPQANFAQPSRGERLRALSAEEGAPARPSEPGPGRGGLGLEGAGPAGEVPAEGEQAAKGARTETVSDRGRSGGGGAPPGTGGARAPPVRSQEPSRQRWTALTAGRLVKNSASGRAPRSSSWRGSSWRVSSSALSAPCAASRSSP